MDSRPIEAHISLFWLGLQAQQQAALQAHAEQSRLQLSELRNEQAALRERQARLETR